MRRSLYYPEVPDWVKDAACIDYPATWWFPTAPERGGAAVEVCKGCPVIQECLDYALDNDEDYGVWGGLTPGGRRRELKRRAS